MGTDGNKGHGVPQSCVVRIASLRHVDRADACLLMDMELGFFLSSRFLNGVANLKFSLKNPCMCTYSERDT